MDVEFEDVGAKKPSTDTFVVVKKIKGDVLKPGTYEFGLIAIDENNFESAEQTITIRAVGIDAKLNLGNSDGKAVPNVSILAGRDFVLTADGSASTPPGSPLKYVFTLKKIP